MAHEILRGFNVSTANIFAKVHNKGLEPPHTNKEMLSLLLLLLGLLSLVGVVVQADLHFDNLTCDDTAGRFCGNGVCNQLTGACECFPSWSTKADFVVMEGDCATNVIGIYVLWALNIVAILYSYYSSLGVILVS
jgi:hypothetical protein